MIHKVISAVSRDLYYARRRISLLNDLSSMMHQLKKDIPQAALVKKQPKIVFAEGLGGKFDVEFRNDGDRVIISLNRRLARYIYDGMWEHLITQYYWYARSGPDIGPILVNVSDGEASSVANFSPSSFLSDVALLPDTHFFKSRGYLEIGKIAATSPVSWPERSDDIVWRGSAFGQGYLSFAEEMAKNPATYQRIRLAHLAKGSEVDFCFVEHELTDDIIVPMLKSGLMGERIPEPSWVNRKYAIDIDGFTNAWSNFFIRMKLGCCVFKVDSQFGYKQWYYDRIKPFKHYIPIKADLSDLFEKIDWARAHPAECEQIAAAGQAFVNEMTFASVTAEAVEIISNNWNRK